MSPIAVLVLSWFNYLFLDGSFLLDGSLIWEFCEISNIVWCDQFRTCHWFGVFPFLIILLLMLITCSMFKSENGTIEVRVRTQNGMILFSSLLPIYFECISLKVMMLFRSREPDCLQSFPLSILLSRLWVWILLTDETDPYFFVALVALELSLYFSYVAHQLLNAFCSWYQFGSAELLCFSHRHLWCLNHLLQNLNTLVLNNCW